MIIPSVAGTTPVLHMASNIIFDRYGLDCFGACANYGDKYHTITNYEVFYRYHPTGDVVTLGYETTYHITFCGTTIISLNGIPILILNDYHEPSILTPLYY